VIDEMNGGEKKGMLHVKANNKLSKRLAVCIGESRTGQVNPTNRGNDHNENKQRNVVVETKYTKKKYSSQTKHEWSRKTIKIFKSVLHKTIG